MNETPAPCRTAFLSARIVDPASGYDGPGGLLIEGETILDVGAHLTRDAVGEAEMVECQGCVLAPGLIDARVFVGEPGAEHRETLATASQAAAAGGVTTIVTMPDTRPVIDDAALVDFLRRRARDTAIVRVEPAAALTKNLEGREMTEIGLLREAGAVAFTEGRRSVANARVMRRLLAYARDFDALVMHHVQDPDLAGQGVMNEGELAARLGLVGIPSAAETIMLDRDLRLAALTGGRYHAAQISCAESLEAIEIAKERGLRVTCGVSINNLALNEVDVGAYRTFTKLSPPLRAEHDRRAMVEGLREGAIDIIVSDHDPQDVEDKRHPFAEAAFGAVGVETLLPAALRLVHGGDLGLPTLLSALTDRPARLLGLDRGRLAPGAPADLVLFDPDAPWILDRDRLRSRAKNTPFDEARFEGRVLRTVVAGRTVCDYRPDRQN
jgi:dihydroorotase